LGEGVVPVCWCVGRGRPLLGLLLMLLLVLLMLLLVLLMLLLMLLLWEVLGLLRGSHERGWRPPWAGLGGHERMPLLEWLLLSLWLVLLELVCMEQFYRLLLHVNYWCLCMVGYRNWSGVMQSWCLHRSCFSCQPRRSVHARLGRCRGKGFRGRR
jgi:hypothetical protein